MPVIHISNGTIEDIISERGTTFVTVNYREDSRSGSGDGRGSDGGNSPGDGRGPGGRLGDGERLGGVRPDDGRRTGSGSAPDNRRRQQTVRLAVGRQTVILNRNGRPVPASALRIGMVINAVISSAMTRSIPPQASAYLIEIVREPASDIVTMGTVLNIDRRNRSFTTISDRDFSSIIQFNISENTRFLDRFGRSMDFSGLTQGMRVRVWHANFMTASIPPQTTAFEVRVL